MLSIAILAGGLARRLHPLTKTIPKALVDVSGKPFIFHQLTYLKNQGLTDVVLCVGYLGNMIEDIVGDGSQFGLSVTYSTDGDVLLGTGGALKKALPYLGKSFFVMYGDSFLPINFQVVQNVFLAGDRKALMTILRNDNRWDKSNVSFVEGNLIEYNKSEPNQTMSYIDYGLGIISSEVFLRYSEGISFDLADVYRDLSHHGELKGLEVFERFYEIGSHQGLIETNAYFSLRRTNDVYRTAS